MARVVAFTSVTLDGVMQAPGRPDEDTRGGFEHGGRAAKYADEESGKLAAEGSDLRTKIFEIFVERLERMRSAARHSLLRHGWSGQSERLW